MTTAIHCGAFEAERYWREADLAVLPSIPDRNSQAIINAMDELLFVFCKTDDILLTRNVMNKAHCDYLRSIGFQFRTNRRGWAGASDHEPQTDSEWNVFQLISSCRSSEDIITLLPEGARLEPFAVLPGSKDVIQRYRLAPNLPEEDIVRKVNAKAYSLAMRDRLNIRNIGIVIENERQLLEEGTRLLHKGSFLMKDDYGVSGKGNLSIDSERALLRIANYLGSQVKKGKEIRFILEPLLERDVDFSCQFKVGEQGEVTILSVQKLQNNGFAFGATHSLEPAWHTFLQHNGYFDLMQQIGSWLHKDGYFGDVCVDSMLLKDGSIEPLVEINARKSMSLIKYNVDLYLGNEGLQSCLIQLPCKIEMNGSYEFVLETLRDKGLLYEQGKRGGVLPLSAGTLFPVHDLQSALGKTGRLYAAIAYRDEKQRIELIRCLKTELEAIGILPIAVSK